MYLWSNLFTGQISVSKTTSSSSPLYFQTCPFSTDHLLLFSASCNDFTAQSCPTLSILTFTQTEVLQHLISNLHFWTQACKSDRAKFTPLASREDGTHGGVPGWGDFLVFPGAIQHKKVSKAEILTSSHHPTVIPCFLTIPNISIPSSQREHLQCRVLLIK